MDWSLLEAAPDAMVVVSELGGIEFANAQAERVFGYSSIELSGAAVEMLLPVRYRQAHAEHLARFFASPRLRPMGVGPDLFGLCKGGQEIPIEVSLGWTRVAGTAVAIVAIRDITNRKRLEETARSSDELAALLTSIADAVIATDLAGSIDRLNPTAEQLTGWSLAEAVGRNLEDVFRVVDEETRAPVPSPVPRALRDGTIVGLANHSVLLSRDGSERHIASSAAPIRNEKGETTGVVLVFRDQSEERRHHVELARSEARYRGLFDHMREGLALCRMLFEGGGPDFVYLEVNRSFETLTGLKDVVGKRVSEVIPGIRESDSELFEIYGRVASTGRPERFEIRVQALNAWFSVSVYSPMKDHFVAIFDVITERKGVEEALRRAAETRAASEAAALESRAQLSAILDSAPDFVCSVDRAGNLQFVNRLLPRYAGEQVIGSPWLSYVPPEHHAVMGSALASVLESGDPRTLETTTVGTDGSPLWFSTHIGRVGTQGHITGAVIVARDVTERKRTEAQLVASDRMAAIGMLAAGVAHEINNPLAAVMANLDLAYRSASELTERLGLVAELVEELRDARDCAERIRAIVRDLKIFSRVEEDKREPVDARRVLESTLRMVWNEIRHRARLVKQYGAVPLVEANESRLGQVFLNLLVNAAQSIPAGRAEANEIRVTTRLDARGYVVVEVADTGSGMSPEIQKRLFTPFFTTKPAGVGTGLGLAICQRIVLGLDGRIEVESEPGRGTVFRVHLPPARSEEALGAAPVVTSPGAGRRGRILVIDDEPMMGSVIRRILAAEHEVVTATRAREALGLLLAGERFDVILCDLMMPEVTGMDLHGELARSVPGQAERMVFMTGGAFTEWAREFLDSAPNLRIEKPFDPAQLRALVNDRVRGSA